METRVTLHVIHVISCQQSIQLAHDDMRMANIYVNSGELLDANINRSPYAYYNNPQEEIDRWEQVIVWVHKERGHLIKWTVST